MWRRLPSRQLGRVLRPLGTAASSEPHPMRVLFPPQPVETRELNEDFELIWDDGQAPEPCLDQYDGISTSHAAGMLTAAFVGLYGIYQLAKLRNKQNPATMREFRFLDDGVLHTEVRNDAAED